MTLDEKITNADSSDGFIYYYPPYEYKYMIVEFYNRHDKPLKVVGYFFGGENLKTGEPYRCLYLYNETSTNFTVIEDGFTSKEEAKLRMKELKEARK